MVKQPRAALLCRVSTIERQSNERQVDELLVLAKAKNYIVEKDDIYEDKVSGYSKFEDRPALNQLLHNLKTKKKHYDIVFVHEISRLSRNPDEGQKILLQFSELEVPIYFRNISTCTHHLGEYDHKGKLKRNNVFGTIFMVYQEMANAEGHTFRERSISGQRLRLKKGMAGGGAYLPYGYKKAKDGMLVVDEEERGVIEDIYNYAAKGYGVTTICKILNDSGVPTRVQKTNKKGFIITRSQRVLKTENVKWSDGTLQSILSNSIYYGERQIKTDEKWEGEKKVEIFSPVKVPGIITQELFDMVQRIRTQRYNKRSTGHRFLFLLRDLCVCGVCGRNLVGRFKPGKDGERPTDSYMQCSSKRIGYENCGGYSVSIEAIESVVWNVVTHSPTVFEYFQSTGTQLQDAIERMERLKTELKFQEKSLQDLEKEKETVKMMWRKQVMEENEFDSEWEKLKKKGESIQHQISRTRKQMTSVSELRMRLSNMDAYLEVINQMKIKRDQMNLVLNNVLDKVIVTATEKTGIGINYLVSIYLKDLLTPITVYIMTKMRHRNFKDIHFDMSDPEVIESTGQNRFLYVPGGLLGEEVIKYDSNGVLLSNPQEVVKYITDRKVKKKEEVKSLHKDSVFARDQMWVWPELVPFEESNAIDHINEVKRRKLKEAN